MKLDDAWLFVEIVNHKGISAAAKAHNIQRSKVSRRLQELEARLGTELMIRSTRKLELTESGKQLYALASEPLNAVKDGLDGMKSDRQEFSGHIRLAIPSALITSSVFSSVIMEYSEKFPNIRLEVENHQKSIDLKKNKIDLQILPNAVDISDDSYVQFRLVPYKCCFVASRTYIDSHAEIQSVEDLNQHRLLVNRYHSHLLRDGYRVALKSDDLYMLRAMVVNGMGVAFLPELHVRSSIKNGELVSILPFFQHKELQLTMVYASNNYLPSKVKVLIDMFRNEFGH